MSNYNNPQPQTPVAPQPQANQQNAPLPNSQFVPVDSGIAKDIQSLQQAISGWSSL